MTDQLDLDGLDGLAEQIRAPWYLSREMPGVVMIGGGDEFSGMLAGSSAPLIIAAVNALPTLITRLRAAEAATAAAVERAEHIERAVNTFALEFIMAHDDSPEDSHLRLTAFRNAVRDLCAALPSTPVAENA